MKKIFLKSSLMVLLLVTLTACKKEYLDTLPTTAIRSEEVFKTTDGGYVALNGIYRMMWATYGGSQGHFGQKSADLTMDLMGNDMITYQAGYGWFNSEYALTAITSPLGGTRSALTWAYYYQIINNANVIIENIDNASGAVADKENIKGQALALRAHSYFYLINLWQHTYKGNETKPGVPLYTTSSIVGKPRGTVQQVYTQILADLGTARTLLTGKTRKSFSHINTSTVDGIWARVALQMEDWPTAATKAAAARTGYALMSNTDYTSGFSKRNGEWMWTLEIPNDQATIYGSFWSHMDHTAGGYSSLGMWRLMPKALHDLIPAADTRKTLFPTAGLVVPPYGSTKFRLTVSGSWAGDYVLMRSAEMYLIEAEAKAKNSDEPGAILAINALVQPRNSAYDATSLTGTALVDEIRLQRRIELWGEGFSLLDIKRLNQPLARATGTGNHQALATVFTLPAADPKWLFKIPQGEFDTNKSLVPADQNP